MASLTTNIVVLRSNETTKHEKLKLQHTTQLIRSHISWMKNYLIELEAPMSTN